MNYLLSLSEADSRNRAGGKGFGLHRLESWGLDVPPAYVVASDAYRAAMSLAPVADLVHRWADAPEDRAAEAVKAVHDALLDVPMDPGLVDGMQQAWSDLSSSGSGECSLFCRSSATAEDSAAASFAGQFSTVMGVRTPDEMAQAVRTCWASVWSPEAAAYRKRVVEELAGISMAVVVQRAVRSDVSGVAFSINPVTGDLNEVLINSNWGLGETVVSGMVTPDTFVVDRSLMQVTVQDISQDKTVQHVISGDGTVESVQVDPVRAMSPSLTDEQAVQVAELAVRIEEFAGAPQDIEWTIEDGRIFVLQTRPITAAG